MDTLENLIKNGEELISLEDPNAGSRFDLWKDECIEFLKENYGEGKVNIFEDLFEIGVWDMSGNTPKSEYVRQDKERINKGVNFLANLRGKAPKQVITASTEKSPFENVKTMHVGGNLVFGDNNTINQITLGEILVKLERIIESSTVDTEEKNAALKGLKLITENASFAGIASTVLATFLG